MDIQSYQKIRHARSGLQTQPRANCSNCRRPVTVCYCAVIKAFSPNPRFVILIHRDEARRGVATGRMAHLCLKNSVLLEGTDFSSHPIVNQFISDPSNQTIVLYPAEQATNFNLIAKSTLRQWQAPETQLVIFLIDATWAKARKMWRLSQNLHKLPLFSLTPNAPSAFRVRKQPKPDCLSTLEAIHQTLDLIQPPDKNSQRPHDNLLEVFQFMVNKQVFWEEKHGRRSVRGIRNRREQAPDNLTHQNGIA